MTNLMDSYSLRGFFKQPELAVLAAGEHDSSSPRTALFGPTSL